MHWHYGGISSWVVFVHYEENTSNEFMALYSKNCIICLAEACRARMITGMSRLSN